MSVPVSSGMGPFEGLSTTTRFTTARVLTTQPTCVVLGQVGGVRRDRALQGAPVGAADELNHTPPGVQVERWECAAGRASEVAH